MLFDRNRTILVILAVFFVASLAACSRGESKSVQVELAPASQLPANVQQADPKVREAYQFAIANQDYLANFPCYCGCGAMDHESNLDCYIDEVKPDGTIAFDNHAFQ